MTDVPTILHEHVRTWPVSPKVRSSLDSVPARRRTLCHFVAAQTCVCLSHRLSICPPKCNKTMIKSYNREYAHFLFQDVEGNSQRLDFTFLARSANCLILPFEMDQPKASRRTPTQSFEPLLPSSCWHEEKLSCTCQSHLVFQKPYFFHNIDPL